MQHGIHIDLIGIDLRGFLTSHFEKFSQAMFISKDIKTLMFLHSLKCSKLAHILESKAEEVRFLCSPED